MADPVLEEVRLTYSDYLRIPNDGRRHEIIHGEHCMSPAPIPSHQAVLGAIYVQMYRRIDEKGSGRVLCAPVDVELSDHDIVQPDIIVIAESRRSIIRESRIIGVPDLIIEILSPSNSLYDRRDKRSLYESVGVPEYWIIDTLARCADCYRLSAGAYAEALTAAKGIEYRHPEMSASVDLTRVWRAV